MYDHILISTQVQAHQLGVHLSDIYFNNDSPSRIRGVRTDLVDLKQVHVRVKVGGEGAAVFDSATAVLQGLFPPESRTQDDSCKRDHGHCPLEWISICSRSVVTHVNTYWFHHLHAPQSRPLSRVTIAPSKVGLTAPSVRRVFSNAPI